MSNYTNNIFDLQQPPLCTSLVINAPTTAIIGSNVPVDVIVSPNAPGYLVYLSVQGQPTIQTATDSNGLAHFVFNTTGLNGGQSFIQAIANPGVCQSFTVITLTYPPCQIGLSPSHYERLLGKTVTLTASTNAVPTGKYIIRFKDNGNPINQVPLQSNGQAIYDWTPSTLGTHTITAEAFNTDDGTTQCISNPITIEITPPGNLYMTSIPDNANISLIFEGQSVPGIYHTPILLPALDPGYYSYTLTLPGYQDAIGYFYIIGGLTTEIPNILMSPLPTLGDLCIFSDPGDAFILIDGSLVNEKTIMSGTQCTQDNKLKGLSPGSHEYQILLSNYHDKSGAFDISVGQTTTIDVGTLEPLPVPTDMGGFGTIIVAGLFGAILLSGR